jgi:hypothetical protein
MKKLIFILPLMFTLISFSQTEKPITKGNIILSGGETFQYYRFHFENVNESKANILDLSFNPGFGYLIIDNLAIRLNTNIGNSDYGGANKFYTLGVGPFVKYYFNNGLFVKTDSSYTYLHGIGSNTTTNKDYSIIPGVGYAFFINQKVSPEPCLSYQYAHNNYDDTIAKLNGVLLEIKLNIFL